jgi:hypothetical protein
MRTWTKVGEDLVGSPIDDETILDRGAVCRAIDRLQWMEIPKEGTLEVAMMPGLGIKESIKELRIPKVSHIAISSALAPYGFYGIRAHYKNGDAEIFLIDVGSNITPVCTDFTPKEKENATTV